MAVTDTPTLDITGKDPHLGPPDPGASAGDGEARLNELEGRLERQSTRRDGWTLTIFGFSALALVASALALVISAQAGSDAKRQARAAATAAVAASVPKASAPAPAAVAAAPRITLTEFKVAATATTVSPGSYPFSITNSGTVPHEFLVFKSDLSAANYPVDASGHINEEATGITLVSDGENVDPGASQSRTIDLTAPGKYLYVCNLPGHFKAGMFVEVTVR
jgi:uncharacterized cupredoxin-like copper-binding protein